jgi:hypothetical protein
MPIICITIVLLPTEDFLIQYNEKVYSYIIDIISYANHALNKLIYPIIKIYCQSGYISAKYKFIHISLKDWILEFFDFWYSIIIIIVSLILRAVSEEQANVFEFLLNYLNILDLIKVYIEIAYSIGNLTLYYNKVIKLKEEYKYFIIGKISIFRRKKIESFKKHFKTLCQLNLTYIKDNAKFNSLSEIPTFIDKIKSEQYFKEEELGLIEPEFLDENMTRKKLESFKKHFKKLCQLNLTYIKDNSKFNCLSEIPTFIDKIKSEQYLEMEELGLIEPEILDESMTRQKLESIISEPYEK